MTNSHLKYLHISPHICFLISIEKQYPNSPIFDPLVKPPSMEKFNQEKSEFSWLSPKIMIDCLPICLKALDYNYLFFKIYINYIHVYIRS